jgi:hypothetical protein
MAWSKWDHFPKVAVTFDYSGPAARLNRFRDRDITNWLVAKLDTLPEPGSYTFNIILSTHPDGKREIDVLTSIDIRIATDGLLNDTNMEAFRAELVSLIETELPLVNGISNVIVYG